MTKFRNNWLSYFLFIMLIIICLLAVKSYNLESNKRILKSDFIELSDVKYGLFNIDKWKEKIAFIIGKKIKELKLSGTNRTTAKKKIITFLNEAIDDFENNYRIKNKNKSLLGISIKNIGANFFGIFDEFRNNIPNISDEILNFLDKKENIETIKNYVLFKLNIYTANTFQKIDYSTLNNILEKHQTSNENECKQKITIEIDAIEENLSTYNTIIFAVTLLSFLLILFTKTYTKPIITLVVLIALHFLILGLLLPMIDIDARISTMEFNLLGETISFHNQVLYFKSKSILEMANVMLTHDKLKIIIVGILVLVFSVIFPFTKLFSTILLLYKEKFASNKFIDFMVFKSGKWSMADVMVVAIFMSYIGFSGIISNQLSQLENITNDLSIVTTNYSELQSGFFFFLTFVLASIVVSQILYNKFFIITRTSRIRLSPRQVNP